jgi:hypothetical protein
VFGVVVVLDGVVVVEDELELVPPVPDCTITVAVICPGWFEQWYV